MVAISHFSDVGFALNTANAASFGTSLNGLIPNCQMFSLGGSDSDCLIKDKSGAELHIGLKRNAGGAWELQTTNPAFSGDGHAAVEIVADVSDSEYNPFERTFSAHFSGDQAPIVFELADPREASAFIPGAKVTISIAAFSYEPHVFADAASYMKSQGNEKIKFAANFFVPSGMFFRKMGGTMEDNAKHPSPDADFAGTILKAEQRTNSFGQRFWWTSVKTDHDAIFDVVIDPASIKSDPKVGSIIGGRFWLSARVAP
jgi:hypothetical protein